MKIFLVVVVVINKTKNNNLSRKDDPVDIFFFTNYSMDKLIKKHRNAVLIKKNKNTIFLQYTETRVAQNQINMFKY